MAPVNLIELAKQNPEAVADYTIQQIVGICGDGNLRDNSTCSSQLREYLALQGPDRLSDYAQFCLKEGFPKSGFVLQDIVNEIGRRLDYEVENGRYQGVPNQPGFDGLWFDGKRRIIVEVKTTDAYRINIDTIGAYADKIDFTAKPVAELSILIVVGRQDTGDLEAQVRGSKHAWSARLISADALIKMMFVKEEVDDPVLLEKLQRILLPFEYTRVDNIVDLVFDTQQEQEQKSQSVEELQDDTGDLSEPKGAYIFTPKLELESKRDMIINAFFKKMAKDPVRVSKTNFTDKTRQLAVTCAVSKRYKRDYQPYWYALHPQWLDFMRSGKNAYFVLGCMDRQEAYVLPLSTIEEHLSDLNQTKKEDKHYWHIALTLDQGHLFWNLSRVGKKIELAPYLFALG